MTVLARTSATIRDAAVADAAELARIYNHYIVNTLVTFEETAIEAGVMAARVAEVREARLPWLVAAAPAGIDGFAHASRWKGRCAYRHSVEVTAYLDPGAIGRGLGSALYEVLFARLRDSGCHVIIGGIALPNPASVALHEKFGLRKAAQFSEIGRKFGRWIDVGYWQLTLPETGLTS